MVISRWSGPRLCRPPVCCLHRTSSPLLQLLWSTVLYMITDVADPAGLLKHALDTGRDAARTAFPLLMDPCVWLQRLATQRQCWRTSAPTEWLAKIGASRPTSPTQCAPCLAIPTVTPRDATRLRSCMAVAPCSVHAACSRALWRHKNKTLLHFCECFLAECSNSNHV